MTRPRKPSTRSNGASNHPFTLSIYLARWLPNEVCPDAAKLYNFGTAAASRARSAREAKQAGQSEKRRKMAQDLERRERAYEADRQQEMAARNKLNVKPASSFTLPGPLPDCLTADANIELILLHLACRKSWPGSEKQWLIGRPSKKRFSCGKGLQLPCLVPCHQVNKALMRSCNGRSRCLFPSPQDQYSGGT